MIKQILAHVIAFILGFFPALFLIAVSLFSDPGPASEFIVVFVVIFGIYSALGLIFGFIIPRTYVFISLCITACLLVLLLTLLDTPQTLVRWALTLFLPLLATASAAGGEFLGNLIRLRYRKK
jgi:hypothetical protein